jgi:hypothetical protein
MSTKNAFKILPAEVTELSNLAIEVWRLEKKVQKINGAVSPDHFKSINNSVLKIKSYLIKQKIEVIDFTGSSYNDGLNIDVLSFSDEKRDKPFISDTIEPMIKFNGKIVKRAKVIVTK